MKLSPFSLICVLVFFLSSFTHAETLDFPLLPMNLSTPGIIDQDNSYSYFYIEIPDNITKDTYNLVVTVKENSVLSEFSDPDIYISKTIPKPTYQTATWSCEKYGQDIVSINSQYVYAKEIFYISVYCQFKCNFSLKAVLVNEIEIFQGKVYSFRISKGDSLNLKFVTDTTEFNELSMAFVSSLMKPFSVYVSKNPSPSSGNSFDLDPSWMNGYAHNILKGSDEYCLGCTYHILINGDEKNDNEINFLFHYLGKEISLVTTSPLFNSIGYEKQKCYSIETGGIDNRESLIISVMLFSGSIVVQLNGYESKLDMKFEEIPNDQTSFDITSERVIILTVDDLKAFKDKAKGEKTKFHFCVFGYEQSSYMVKAHFESQITTMQRFNYLLTGNSISGYLPKGHVTSYRILEFTRDGNITITLDDVEGDAVLYAVFSNNTQSVYYDKRKVDKEKDKLIQGEKKFSGYKIEVLNSDNDCHKQILPNTNLDDELRKLGCAMYVIVECQDITNNCLYRIRAIHDESSQQLIPRTSFYNILPKDEEDYFTITIDDKDVEQVSVVLNAISGDTQLEVYTLLGGMEKVLGVSYNEGILPNVVTITKDNSDLKTLQGRFFVKVTATSFSTYSIYYYTKSKNGGTQPEKKDIALNLDKGHIIYDSMPKDKKYKIYSYEIDATESFDSDIRITLTRRNFPCEFFVFLNLDTFKLDSYDEIKGYDWISDYNNELVIQKTDPKYSKKGPYYIVVSRTYFMGLDNGEADSYYIGVTDEKTSFLLFENMQHSVALNDKYTYQSYWYTHPDASYDFTLSLNVLYGTVNIYIDFTDITAERLESKNSFYYYKESTETIFITITDETLQQKCKFKKNCPIFIYLSGDSSVSQYIIIAQSRKNKITHLIPDVLSSHSINLDEKQYFLIEEYSNEPKISHIYAVFTSGEANIYMNEAKDSASIELKAFPTEEKYQYKAEDSFYQGKIITFRQEKCSPCRYLITVHGTSIGFHRNNNIIYSLTYSNLITTLSKNNPHRGFIQEDQLQYFRFVSGSDTKNIHISLYTTEGDVSIYMNYGDSLPTVNKFHWFSDSIGSHFINIDKSDTVILSQGKNSLEGVYTILVYGFTNATYTLYVTDNDYKVTPISNNQPGSCMCKAKGEYCYFRFDLGDDIVFVDGNVQVAFATQYTYGSGDILANLRELEKANDINEFPTEDKYDFSNREANKRNFMKVSIPHDNQLLSKRALLLLSVLCNEPSLFDINAAQISNSHNYYLEQRRENIFYLTGYTNTSSILSFYMYIEKDLNFEVYSYTGKGYIEVYQNYWTYNSEKDIIEYKYETYINFTIDSYETFYHTIKPTNNSLHKNLYFKVSAITNFGFYVKLNYDEEMTKILTGEESTYLVNKGKFYGYFDIHDQYQDIILNVKINDPNKIASVYVKINIIDKNKTEGKSERFDMPNEENYDYFSSSNFLLSSASIKIQEIPKEKKENKLVRAIFMVNVPDMLSTSSTSAINILVSPSVSNIKRISLEPLSFYHSSDSVDMEETTVFDITKAKKTDDIVIIEISSCKGDFSTSLTKELNYFNKSPTNAKNIYEKEKRGRKILTVVEADSSSYYLSVWPKDNYDKGEYLVYYYTTSKEAFTQSINDLTFTYNIIGKEEIELILPELKEKDYLGNHRNIDRISFSVFISTNVIDFSKMESLCYLSKMDAHYEGTSYEYNKEKNVINVKGLKNKNAYFINIEMKNLDTGEMVVFLPIQVVMTYKGLNVWFFVFAGIILAIIMAIGVVFYRKYKKTKEVLNFQTKEVREEGPTKAMAEMGTVKSKYASLTDEISVNL